MKVLKVKLFKFASVGALATLAHATVYLLFLDIFYFSDQVSNLIGFVFAFFISFYGQRYWAFSSNVVSNENKAKIKFLVSSLLSLSLNALWVYITVNTLGFQSEYAVIGILFLTPIIIFFTLNYWVFV